MNSSYMLVGYLATQPAIGVATKFNDRYFAHN